MLQQINLYRQLKKSEKLFLSLHVILIACGLFVGILFLSSVYDYTHIHSLKKQMNVLKIQLENETVKLNQIKEQYPSVNLANLEASIKRLQQELGSKGEMLAIISRQTKFSDYLNVFSETIVPGVWLTDIAITHYGQQIALKGKTTEVSLVHQFIEQLQKKPLFSKMTFQVEEINQAVTDKKDAETYINFVITIKSGIS